MDAAELARCRAALTDRYVIERELGRGAMATVFLGRDVKHGREVAVKVLDPHVASAIGRDRFLREIRVAARLNHPHILPLHDSGQADGFLFYVMPKITGESLRSRLLRERQLSVAEALRITTDVAAALQHAHAQGIVHRDVKPENILLHEGEAMVADFGIALASSGEPRERMTTSGVFLGTMAYMSPEQSLGERAIDARSDVYSLACVLYEMLAGEPPYMAATAQALLAKRLTDPVPGVRRLRASVPAAIERALLDALALVPADRTATIAAFSAALERPDADTTVVPSVAVLPFLDLNANPDNEFFAEGITEDVIAHLARIRALRVVSRSSVMRFKRRELGPREIGAALNVATMLDGSVRRVGDRVRIVAQLVDTHSEEHLWAETYDRQLSDIFAIQTDVALRIATALQAELSPEERTRIGREPTHDMQAYQLCLQGRHCLIRYTEEGIHKAVRFFERAVERDPDYAQAYAGLALCHAELMRGQGGGSSDPRVVLPRAREAIAKALALDDTLGEAHSVLGLIRYIGDFDWAGAEQSFRRALELSPGSADAHDLYAQMLSARGRSDEAIPIFRRAQELDPMAHRSDFANELLRAGRLDEAIAAANATIDFDPIDPRGYAVLGWSHLGKGDLEQGLAGIETAVAHTPGDTMFLGQLGQAYAIAGQPDRARAVLEQLLTLSRARWVSPYHLAYVYTGLGELDRALDFLEQASELRAGAISGIKGSFLFRRLHGHARFQALLRKMNLD